MQTMRDMKTKGIKYILLAMMLSAFIAGYSQDNMKGMKMNSPAPGIQKAVCVLYPTLGNSVTGTVTFTKVDGGIKVVADLQGLTKGKHGFHIHECGDCSSADGSSAGGHFNPAGMNHGAPMDMSRHAGDMGNIEADDAGKAHLEYVDRVIAFEGAASVIGRSMIVHKSEDDLKTQPTGNAGPRVACGVIGIAK
jgi:superoxide dismutase, Cu-Zn family